jgi:hypothetical protein
VITHSKIILIELLEVDSKLSNFGEILISVKLSSNGLRFGEILILVKLSLKGSSNCIKRSISAKFLLKDSKYVIKFTLLLKNLDIHFI